MMKFMGIFLVLTVLVVGLAACASPMSSEADSSMSAEEMMTSTPADDMMAESSGDEMMADSAEESMPMHATTTPDEMMAGSEMSADMASPGWFAASLTNVNTGEAFNINDLRGKVVLVETMAQWCTNCLKQQGQVKELHSLLGENTDLVSIALDIDPNEDEPTLKEYTARNGFDWVYAVAPAEVSREIGNLYGAQFLNPPSTPILIVDRSGEAHPLPFGIKSAEDLKQAIEPFLNEGM